MTVQAAEPMWSRDSGNLSSPDGRTGSVWVRRGYSVVTDPDDTSLDVLLASNLPQIRDPWPGTQQLRVVDVKPERVSPIFWIVMVEWRGVLGSEGIFYNGTPAEQPPTIQWSNLVTEEEIDEDVNGNPIATANGERVRGITERVVDWVATVTRYYEYPAFNIPLLHNYLRSVNSDPIITNFGTFAPGVGRLTRFEPLEEYASEHNGFVKVTADVTFRYPYRTIPRRAWWKRYLHEGYLLRKTDPNFPNDRTKDKIINAFDGNKVQSIKPFWLDEDGFLIGTPDPDNPGAVTPYYQEQQTLIELPYAGLGLF